MGGHQANVGEQGARRASCGRLTCPQRQIRRTMADLSDCYGPCTTCYNRFVRWRRAGVWGRIMDALAVAHDAAVQMIDTSIVRVHRHAACIARNRGQSMGRSRGGLTSKIHAVVDTNGLPVRLGLTAGEAHDNRLVLKLLSRLRSGSMLQRMLQAAAPAQRIAGSSQPVGAKLAANWTFRGNGLTDAIDRICDFAITFAFTRNPATSRVLSCLVPSLGGANETALRCRRRTN
jgi:transposase